MKRILIALAIGLFFTYASADVIRTNPRTVTDSISESVAVSTTGWVKTGTNIHQATLTDKVGIGTTNPGSKLHMSSGVFTIDGSGAGAIDLYDSSLEKKVGGIATFNDDMTIFSSNNRDIDFQDDSGVIVTFKDGGNVGIGTASPDEKLVVDGGIRVTGAAVDFSASDGGILSFSNTALNLVAADSDSVTLSSIVFQTDGGGSGVSEKMRIDGNGNVGIGTSNPGSRFSVNGGSMTLTESNGATSVSGEGSIGIYNPNTIAGAIIGLDFWGQTNSGARQISGSIGMKNTGGGGNARGDFFVATGDATLTERLTITNGGAYNFNLGQGGIVGGDFGWGTPGTRSSMTAAGNMTIHASLSVRDITGPTNQITIEDATTFESSMTVQGSAVFNEDQGTGDGAGLRVTPPQFQTLPAGGTISADACGGLKFLNADSSVATDTTDTFEAPSAANEGCCMDVVNGDGADTITLDANAKFVSNGGADVVLGPNGDSLRVCSGGASSSWYQIGSTGDN